MKNSFKQKTMRLTGWTDAEYKKEYDKFKHRVRNFETAMGSSKQRNIASELYWLKYDKKTSGKISLERQAILNTTSAGAKTGRIYANANKQANELLKRRFGALSEKLTPIRNILNDNSLTVAQKNQALKEVADLLKLAKDERGQFDNKKTYEPTENYDDMVTAQANETL